MKHIELRYTNQLPLSILESILKKKFPGKSIRRQDWGIDSPFLWIKMNFWIRVKVYIGQRQHMNKTIIYVRDDITLGAAFLLGWPAYWIFRKEHRTRVYNAIKEGLSNYPNIVFLN